MAIQRLFGSGLGLLLLIFLAGCSTAGTGPAPFIASDGNTLPPADEVVTGDALDLAAPDLPDEPCTSDEECKPYFCDVEAAACVECLINSHCGPGYHCEKKKCVLKSGGCTSDAQCTASGLICDEESGECVECVTPEDCKTGEYCLDGKCLPWQCTPGSKWCNGWVAMVCKEDGSAIESETDCNDGDECTLGDQCVNGACAETEPKSCDDGNPCTDDTCDPKTGCYSQYNSASCDDGTDCTTGDHCVEGKCLPGELVCQCALQADCLPREDADLCNGTLICKDGFCVVDEATVVLCPASENPCKVTQCQPGSGKCINVPLDEQTPCDDDNECTADTVCQEGFCKGKKVTCNDDNPCTADSCDDQVGCLFNPAPAPCDDLDSCTFPDSCMDGVCIGQKLECEDGNPCTQNSCDPAVGCVSTELAGPCEDGDACTTGDTCVESVCEGTPLLCNDDGNPCTNDFCDVAAGCVHPANDLPCDDGNPCTTGDKCSAGECIPGASLFDCDDKNPCTSDSCNIQTGECLHEANSQPCDDADPCTLDDTCVNGSCQPGAPKVCEDSNPCTEDSCNSNGDCVFVPVAASCDDGNQCTGPDSCLGGKCQPGAVLKCNDGNLCTDDSCDPIEGCQYVPNGNACTDGNACTLDDVCAGGKCVGAGTLECGDVNPCTDDSCDPLLGCQNIPNNAACDDKDACTTGDYCAATVCMSGKKVTCDDSNSCTDDGCEPLTGCKYVPNTKECEDGNACTFGDKCAGGTCQPGALNDCNDGNPCTDDVCNFTSCLHPFVEGACEDGNPCTIGDKCGNGMCGGTLVANCGCHSLKLNGTSAYGRVPSATQFNPAGAFTVEAWAKTDQPGDYSILSRWGGSGSTQRTFRLRISAEGNLQFAVILQTGNAGSQEITVSKAGVNLTGAWHHIAGVYNTTQLLLYLDGTLAGSTPASGTPSPSNVPLFIGAAWNPDTSAIHRYFRGNLDELRISSSALYSGNTFVPQPRLAVAPDTIAYWGADQDQFTTLFDTGVSSLHANLLGGPSWSTDTPATTCVPVPDFPPSTPGISISPPNPSDADDLKCVINTPSQDIEKDPISYQYQWYKNGVLQAAYTTDTVPAAATSPCPTWQCNNCESWTCRVTPVSDGKPGYPADASATVGTLQCKPCDGSVYGNHCYKYYGTPENWGAAAIVCQNWGGYLAVVTSAGENQFVDSVCAANCWLGAADVVSEWLWIWITQEPWGYTNWSAGEPNNAGNEDCLMMWSNGLWNDGGCSSFLNYVCEKNP